MFPSQQWRLSYEWNASDWAQLGTQQPHVHVRPFDDQTGGIGEENAVRFAIEFEDCSHLKVDGWGLLRSFDMHKTPGGYFEADFRGVEAAIGFRFGRLSIRGARRFRSGAA